MFKNKCLQIGLLTSVLYLLFFFCSTATATTYYIDFVAGKDTNNGTSNSTPWKHCPGDSQATRTAGHSKLDAGDTLIFKGGVVYTTTGIRLNWSGMSESIITYDGNSAGTWGTGRAIIDGRNAYTGSIVYGFHNATAKSYIAINNFEIRNMAVIKNTFSYSCTAGNTIPCQEAYGIYLYETDHVTITNNYIHDISYYENEKASTRLAMCGNGVRLYNGNNITVNDNEISKVFGAVRVEAAGAPNLIHDVTVSNNYFHDFVTWDVDVVNSGTGSHLYSINIYGNRFEMTTDYIPWNGCAGLYPHCDGIIYRRGGSGQYTKGSFGTPTTPTRVYNNKFYQADTVDSAGTAAIFSTGGGGSLWVYNNTFVGVNYSNGNIYVQDGTKAADCGTGDGCSLDYRFYNNSFYNNGISVPIFLRTLVGAAYALNRTGNFISIKNNIFYTNNRGNKHAVYASTTTDNPTELDYNIYLSARKETPKQIVALYNGSNIAAVTLAGARALGFETHGIYGDPLYKNISYGLGPNSNLNNLSLTSRSPCLNKGKNLSSYFTTDMNGNQRPSARYNWDMGAYQHSQKNISVSNNDDISDYTGISLIPSSSAGVIINPLINQQN
jgi:hypothetical protein